jgi:hypothetical protein
MNDGSDFEKINFIFYILCQAALEIRYPKTHYKIEKHNQQIINTPFNCRSYTSSSASVICLGFLFFQSLFLKCMLASHFLHQEHTQYKSKILNF